MQRHRIQAATAGAPPSDQEPTPPAWLAVNATALIEWKRLVKVLMSCRLLTEGNVTVLEHACMFARAPGQLLDDRRRAERFTDKHAQKNAWRPGTVARDDCDSQDKAEQVFSQREAAQMRAPRNVQEAVRMADEAEAAMIEIERAWIASARARGLSNNQIEALQQMFREAKQRAGRTYQ
jgi:hypothetical protein